MSRRLVDFAFLTSAPVLYLAQAVVVIRLLGAHEAEFYMTITGIAGFALGFVGGSFGTAVVEYVREGYPLGGVLRLRVVLAATCAMAVTILGSAGAARKGALLASVGVLVETLNPQFVMMAEGRIRRAGLVDIVRTTLVILVAFALRHHLNSELTLLISIVVSFLVFGAGWLSNQVARPVRPRVNLGSLSGFGRIVLPMAALGVLPKVLDSAAVTFFFRLTTSGICDACGVYPLASRFANVIPIALSITLTYCLARGVRVVRESGVILMFAVLLMVGWVGGTLGGIGFLLTALSGDPVSVPARIVFFAVAIAGMGMTLSTLQVGLVQRDHGAVRNFALGVLLCGALILAGEGLNRWTKLS